MEVDSFDGHHYISSIAPGGPVDTLSLLQPEDELLEVKFIKEHTVFKLQENVFPPEIPQVILSPMPVKCDLLRIKKLGDYS